MSKKDQVVCKEDVFREEKAKYDKYNDFLPRDVFGRSDWDRNRT